MSGIQIKDLSFAYEAGGKLILKDINTEIGEGEFVCILGQSGCGKSTLLVYNIVWATLFATITGIMTIDKRYLDKAATLELTGVKRFMKVILPAASPSILAGFVNSLRSSFVMLVFAQMYGGGSGMGYFVKKNSELGVFANTWVGFIFMVIVLVVVMQIFEKVKEQLLKWTID